MSTGSTDVYKRQMKKLVLAFMMGAAARAANAQVNYKVQTACHPQDVKHYDTELLLSLIHILML